MTQIIGKGGEFYDQHKPYTYTAESLARNSFPQHFASIAPDSALFRRVDVRIFCDPENVFLPKISSYCRGFYVVYPVQFHQ